MAAQSGKGSIFSAEGLRTAAFYATYFLAFGIYLPFWPIWLADWGLTTAEVGSYSAAGVAARVVAGLTLPVLADRWDARRILLAMLAAVAMLTTFAHLWISSHTVLLLATLVSSAALAGIVPISDALGAAAARVYRFEYAHARVAGSIAFVVANFLAGWMLGVWGVNAILWGMVIFLLPTIWFGWRHPGGGKAKNAVAPKMADIRKLLFHPVFLIFVLAVGGSQAGHGVYYAYASLHWQALGISDTTIGALWAVGVVAEIILMIFIAPKLINMFGAPVCLIISAIASVARWSAMVFDPAGPWLWIWQMSHALTFALGHLAAISFISRAAPASLAASAQGVYGAMGAGLFLSIAMTLAALIYPTAGAYAYGVGAGFALVSLAMSVVLYCRWNGGLLKT